MTKTVYKLFHVDKNYQITSPDEYNEVIYPFRSWIKASSYMHFIKMVIRPGFRSRHLPLKDKVMIVENEYAQFSVWGECYINDNLDYQEFADIECNTLENQCMLVIPLNGFYLYKDNIISGELFINRFLTDEEVINLNKKV